MEECLFCKIIAGEEPGEIIYQDDSATAFRDARPVAPVHILIVPNIHIDSVNDLREEDEALVGHLFTVARLLADPQGIRETGYRLVVNTGPDSGQAIFHLHMHLLGGQHMRIPLS